MKLSTIMAAIIAVALIGVPVQAETTTKLPYVSKTVIKPGEKYKAIVVGRNVSVTNMVVCDQGGGATARINVVGATAKTIRYTAQATNISCTVTLKVVARSLKHNGFCTEESVKIKAAPTCAIPAATPRAS